MTAFSNTNTLLAMLTYARPKGSTAEREFIERFILPLPGVDRDAFGNYHVRIGDSPIVWSCHTDTVHWFGGRQTLAYDAETGIVKLSKRSKRGQYGSTCLGADDTAGVFLCREMALAGVAGHYIFHFGEETGGEGSSDLAHGQPSLLDGARFAIAFDRRGYSEVITHQAGGRCCSDAFAVSLAAHLNVNGLTYAPCDRGVFTDTANYTDIIGECTNLSVGYMDEHHRTESLDVRHVMDLLRAVSALDPAALVEARKAGERDAWTIERWIENRFGGYQPSDRPTIETPTPLLTHWSETCEECGLAYEFTNSSAEEYEYFCSLECEIAALDAALARSERQAESIYLDPAFEEINAAIDAAKRKVN